MLTGYEYMSRMVRYVAGALVTAFFLLNAPAQAQSQIIQVNADRNIARGQTAMQEGDYSRAITYFQKAARGNLSEEHRVIVQNSMCASLYFQGDFKRAASACTDAIKEDSRYWKAFVNRGHVRKALGDFQGALADYCHANTLSPNNVSGSFVSQCEG